MAPRSTDDEFLTAQQLAAILKVSAATVHRLARAGKIPYFRLTSRLLRFDLRSVREALKDGFVKPETATDLAPDPQMNFKDLV